MYIWTIISIIILVSCCFVFFPPDCNHSYYSPTCVHESLCWPLSSLVLSFVHQEWRCIVHLLPLRSSDAQCWKSACLIFLWRPYCTNEHSGVIRWERFWSWKLFVTDGKNEQTLPVQNDLLQHFAIPAKWLLLPIFALCANFSSTLLTIFFDINYGAISKHSEFQKEFGTTWQTSVELSCAWYKHLVRKL